MKSIFLKYLTFCFIALSLYACKKDESQVVSNVGPAGTLTASTTTLNLSLANGDKTALTLSFPASVVTGYQIPVTTTLQFDLKGKNFASAKEEVVTTTSYAPTVAEVNKMLLALGAKVDEAAEVEVRLKSAPAPNAVTYSNVITLKATPYLASSWMYVPGAYQGWNVETADSLISETSNGIYIGLINFTPGNLTFKVTPAKKWDVAYGDGGGNTISTSGGDISAGTPGLKQITVNLNDKTIKIVDATNFWSIIGDAIPGTNWDVDVDLKPINDGKNTWKITTNLVPGGFKFRRDHDWANSIGNNADNINVTAAGSYTLTLTVDAGGTTGTYKMVKN